MKTEVAVERTRRAAVRAIVKKDRGSRMISGFRMRLVHLKIKISLLGIAIRCYRNPLDWWRALGYLISLRRRFLGDHRLQKMAYAGGRYYMGLYTPGWNSAVYRSFIASQLYDFKPTRPKANRFNTVFMAVTKKCALQCEHCYEWEHLNHKDVLTAEKLGQMVKKLQEKGVSQIQFSGGEPLLKMDWLLQLLQGAAKTTDFWVVTSGLKLNRQNAKALKQAGLTGVIVSLDHHLPEKHNAFRGYKDAFYWAGEAVKNAGEQDLAVALSLCATKDFATKENLMAYLELAKTWGVSFVQLLEPKAVGHYRGQDVMLGSEQLEILEDFFLRMNFDPAYRNYPIVTYHGYYQRRHGCYSAGDKGLYVDTDGDINACPFCHTKKGKLLAVDFDKNLAELAAAGCPTYTTKTEKTCFSRSTRP